MEEGPAGSCVAGVAGSLIPPAHEEVDGEARVGTIAQGLMKLEVVGHNEVSCLVRIVTIVIVARLGGSFSLLY